MHRSIRSRSATPAKVTLGMVADEDSHPCAVRQASAEQECAAWVQ